MKKILFPIFLVVFLLSCSQIRTKPITEFSQKDIKNGILVDVRTPEEFENGHLESAVNINWFDEDFAKHFDSIAKDRAVYVYCKSGGRSAKAAQRLDSMGYKKVVDLLGGYSAISKVKD